MEEQRQPAILCISSYEKGQAFLREVASLGVPVSLLTTEKLASSEAWPWESLAAVYAMPENLTPEQALTHVARLFRHNAFQRVVALDEFDTEIAGIVRDHLRLPGLGQTATRFFRDKLATLDD